MIRHIVMFKFMDNADGKTAMENAAEAKVRALALKEQISEIKKIEVQLNSKAADRSNYEFALICDFESIEDLNSYQVNPAHIDFGNFIKPLREARACIDFEF